MAAKAVNEAKEKRQKYLLEFEAAVEDLQDILDAGNGTVRSLKNKLGVVKVAYDDVMGAHARLVTLEKTPSDEVKKEWIKVNLWKPYKAVVKKAEEVIYKDVNEEEEAKVEASVEKTKLKLKMNSMEAIIKAEIEGLGSAVSETTIWLKDNHGALESKADELMENFRSSILS